MLLKTWYNIGINLQLFIHFLLKGEVCMNNEDKILSLLLDIKDDLSTINAKIDHLESRMDKLESRINTLETQFTGLRSDTNSLTFRITKLERSHYDLRDEVTRMHLELESTIIPIQNEILSCYLSTFERYKESTNDIEQLKLDVSALKSSVSAL